MPKRLGLKMKALSMTALGRTEVEWIDASDFSLLLEMHSKVNALVLAMSSSMRRSEYQWNTKSATLTLCQNESRRKQDPEEKISVFAEKAISPNSAQPGDAPIFL